MFSNCQEKMRYKFILFLLVVPLAAHTKTGQKRIKHMLDGKNYDEKYPLIDQIALASNWEQVPNRIISATYASNPKTGYIKEANLIVNLLPHQKQLLQPNELAASESLASSHSAAEYVSKALHMHSNQKIPQSSYVKYDIYEKEKMRYVDPNQISSHHQSKSPPINGTNQRSSKYIHDSYFPSYTSDAPYDYNNNHNEFETPSQINRYKEFEIDSEKRFRHKDPESVSTHTIPKSELIKHIENSVMRYITEMESQGKIKLIVPSLKPHTEIKTYYRLPDPESTLSSHHIENSLKPIKENSENNYLDYFKKSPAVENVKSHQMEGYTTTKPTKYESYIPGSITKHVDLTFRSKGRPKPIDLSTLDVGQSWSYGSTSEHAQKHLKNPAYHQHNFPKPKLHFTSQIYQDINSLTYSPTKGLVRDIYSSSDEPHYGNTHNVQLNEDGIASVGASIIVKQKGIDESSGESIKDLQQHYEGPLHIINGIPVSNPYKLNIDTLAKVFANHHSSIDDDSAATNWTPYSPKERLPSTTIHHNLPYDSYNPKYNNNPDGYGYQETYSNNRHRHKGLMSTDMHTSSSQTKKIRELHASNGKHPKHSNQRQKKNTVKSNKKSKRFEDGMELDTELRPPPLH